MTFPPDPASPHNTGAWTPAATPPPGSPPAPPLYDRPTAPASWPAGPPSGPPLTPSGAGVGAGPEPWRTPTPEPRKRGRGGALAVVAIALALLAGAAGIVIGRSAADDNSPSILGQPNASSRTVSTQPGPVPANAEEPIAAVAQALSPAVVQITTNQGLGSGFIYDKSGLILTAAHVTDGADQVEVRLADGTRLPGKVLGADDSTDVAVVKVNSDEDLPVAVLATGVKLEVGQTAIAIGSPFGLDQTVTAGIVSAVGRSSETPGGVIPAVQTDAPINSGNSGGALADKQGRVIGINDSIITGSQSTTQGGGNVGIGFAVPIDIAKQVADKIVAGKSTDAGFLGVEGADATGNRAGAALTTVQADSPAAKAGLTTDDVVVAVDGQRVSSMIDLAAAVRTHEPGEQVELTVVRNGAERTVTVTLTTAPPRGN